ncbi:MAG: hypothetical protein IKM28_01565 [Lachnospiraceae bacterium]|nr:hypothetical protein [Lachnospiraceae bacterium]
MAAINKTQAQSLLHYFLFDPNIYTSLIITLEKKEKIKTEDIQKAIEQAYTQNETTMSKIVLDNGEAYFENMSKTGCKVFIDQRDWIDILHENEKKTFKLNEGELARTFIIDKQDEVQLLLMVHHILGDGSSMVLLVQDILSNLAGEGVEYKPLNNILEVPRCKYPFAKKIGIKLLNHQWRKTGRTFTWKDYFSIHENFWKDRQSYVKPTTMSESLAEIKEKSTELGITINSYLTAKQLEKNPKYHIIGMPVSIRGNNRSLSNQVIIITLRYQYDTCISFEENAKKIHQCLKTILDDPSKKYFVTNTFGLFDHNLMDGALMAKYTGYQNEMAEKLGSIIGMSGENKTQLGVTNLGKVNLKEEYASFKVQNILVIATPMSTTKDVVCAYTFKDKINLCYSTVRKTSKNC